MTGLTPAPTYARAAGVGGVAPLRRPVGALEEAGLAVSSRAGRSEGGVDGADCAVAVAHRGGDAFHRPGPDVADSEDQRLAGLERQRARPSSAQVAPGDAPSKWVPVSTKPSSSTAMSSGQPVAGGADKAEQPRHGWLLSGRSWPGAAVCPVMASRWPPPCSAVTSVAVRTVMLA